MHNLRFFALPAALLAATAVYVVVNPSGAAVQQLATETPSVTARPTYTPTVTPTPVPRSQQLPGLTGRLTYQSSGGRVTVEFPSGLVVDSPSREQQLDGSDDGIWAENYGCLEGRGCSVSFVGRDAGTTYLVPPGCTVPAQCTGDYRVFPTDTRWRAGSHGVAIGLSDVEGGPTKRILVVDDVADASGRIAYSASVGDIQAFTWYGGQLLIADSNGPAVQLQLLQEDGTFVAIKNNLSGTLLYFYPSPDGRTFAFTQSNAAGWHLMALDASTLALTDYGAMGSDGPNAQPVVVAPENSGKGGPMYVAWSRDSTKLAFGGGFEPPYVMKIVDTRTGNVGTTRFANGYPGEIRWNSIGTEVAVSTYDPERKHHETWVVDADTGVGRHLMDGCIIQWSPDDRFLAVHGEDIRGISIVDVRTGARMRLTQAPEDAPLSWAQ